MSSFFSAPGGIQMRQKALVAVGPNRQRSCLRPGGRVSRTGVRNGEAYLGKQKIPQMANSPHLQPSLAFPWKLLPSDEQDAGYGHAATRNNERRPANLQARKHQDQRERVYARKYRLES